MSKQSPSSPTRPYSTFGKFPSEDAAKETKRKLEESGLNSEQITVTTENFNPPLKLEQTQAINNLKMGAITGGILGTLIGCLVSLILTDFAHLGFAAFENFKTIHYLTPVIAGIVAAAGMGSILSLSGANIAKTDEDLKNINNSSNRSLEKMFLVMIKGTVQEIDLARKIITQQAGIVEESDR
ncbi:hypothetical protein [Crocosphaera chwakensis]|uniref:Uncharacterized protein n=1 Tax=Crocosphaera chwakensis CCY0110 TaxID=391612 RepID=A3IMS6_9CHRO|nr:hypothetical protein [Crocosphaera chwakensis]EAZ92179.1 hypothetical protein CY0110_24751 [Crocosphaera chwakensis CCY0110]